MTDERIVELFFARDEEAITEARQKYDRCLFGLSRRVLYDEEDCREAVSDAYLAAWNSIPPQKPSSLGAYLSRLVRQASIDRYRRLKSKKRGGGEYALSLDELGDVASKEGDPESELEAKMLDGAIGSFVRSLSDTERRLFIGRYYFFDPVSEAAAYCGLSLSAAKSMLFRLRKRLREHLEKEGFEI